MSKRRGSCAPPILKSRMQIDDLRPEIRALGAEPLGRVMVALGGVAAGARGGVVLQAILAAHASWDEMVNLHTAAMPTAGRVLFLWGGVSVATELDPNVGLKVGGELLVAIEAAAIGLLKDPQSGTCAHAALALSSRHHRPRWLGRRSHAGRGSVLGFHGRPMWPASSNGSSRRIGAGTAGGAGGAGGRKTSSSAFDGRGRMPFARRRSRARVRYRSRLAGSCRHKKPAMRPFVVPSFLAICRQLSPASRSARSWRKSS